MRYLRWSELWPGPDPEEWTSAKEPMTPSQKRYLKDLSDEVGFEFDTQLTKAEASRRIELLQRMQYVPPKDLIESKEVAESSALWGRVGAVRNSLRSVESRQVGEPIDQALGKARHDLLEIRSQARDWDETSRGMWLTLLISQVESEYRRIRQRLEEKA